MKNTDYVAILRFERTEFGKAVRKKMNMDLLITEETTCDAYRHAMTIYATLFRRF